jgi:hypothetical protein
LFSSNNGIRYFLATIVTTSGEIFLRLSVKSYSLPKDPLYLAREIRVDEALVERFPLINEVFENLPFLEFIKV